MILPGKIYTVMCKQEPKKKDREVNMSDDNDIEENYENGGHFQCEFCFQPFYITEGYSDEYCSRECYEAASQH